MPTLLRHIIACSVLWVSIFSTSCGEQTDTFKSRTTQNVRASDGAKVDVEFSNNPETESFSLSRGGANRPLSDMADLLKRAAERIQSAFGTENNVVASGVSFSVSGATGTEACTFVQIQQRSWGHVVVKETLVPNNQSPSCILAAKKGLGLALISILVKIAGNNFAAAVGLGAAAFDGKAIAGCGAGAVGYAREAFAAAGGTAGAFCTSVIQVPK